MAIPDRFTSALVTSALVTGTGIAAGQYSGAGSQLGGLRTDKPTSLHLDIRPIKNGYLIRGNGDEFYCVDLATIGAQVVALVAASQME